MRKELKSIISERVLLNNSFLFQPVALFAKLEPAQINMWKKQFGPAEAQKSNGESKKSNKKEKQQKKPNVQGIGEKKS